MQDEQSIRYCIRDTASQQLLRVETETWSTPHFTLHADYPIFEASTLEELALVLLTDPSVYSRTAKNPGWGEFERANMEAVCVTVTTSVATVELPKVAQVVTVQLRDTHEKVAKSYTGAPVEKLSGLDRLVFWLVELPADETLESVQRDWEGKGVYANDRTTRRHLYKACAVPEDYVPLVEGKNAALFIASNCY